MRKVILIFLLLLNLYATSQVTQLSNNTNIEFGISLGGNKVVLFAKNGALWTTNGTPGGTIQFTSKVTYDTTGSGVVLNNKLYFPGKSPGSGDELWVTDGTDAGTSLVKDINPGIADSRPDHFIVLRNSIIFCATNILSGRELWITDGTTSGTVLLKDVNPGAPSSLDNNFQSILNNNILYFTADDGSTGIELWKTDGTTNGTALLKDVSPGKDSTNFGEFALFDTRIVFTRLIGSFFNGQTELWISDGSTAGTNLLKNFGNSSYSPLTFFLNFKNKLYFNASNLNTGNELWGTDGTPSGTTIVKDINPGTASSYPILFFALIINNKFYFSARTVNEGNELWSSDGTDAGTQLVKDINPGTASSNPFILIDYSNIFSHTNLYNGKMFLSADDGTHGDELWITDGTSAGTQLVKDIRPGSSGGLQNFSTYFYTKSGIYFAANDSTHGEELWKSDGTANGTVLVQDINPGIGGSSPQIIGLFNNHLYFTADDGDNINGNRDLYIVDGISSPLPVTLLNFNAVLKEHKVDVEWSTSSEINSKYFKIERSTDGIHFSEIGQVAGSGNSSVILHYFFADQQALTLNSSILFYRLQMIDKDGSSKFSSIASVHLNGTISTFHIMPNPVQNQLIVDFAGNGASKLNVKITNSVGQVLYSQSIIPGAISYRHIINVSSFPKGTYYLQLITDKGINSGKFVKE